MAEPRPDPIMVRLGNVAASRRLRPGVHSRRSLAALLLQQQNARIYLDHQYVV
jgi:hypothetical protein